MFRKILFVLLFLFILIQFFRPARNVASGTQANYIGNTYTVSAEVKPILEKACFDCHSNNTRYPWYNNIQPFAWWLNMHVRDGKAQLNFDEFLSYSVKKQDKKMEESIKEVKEGEMPLKSYTWIHRDAKLNAKEKTLLLDWAVNIRKEITAKTGYVPQLKE
jgi:hypothetical protein